MLQALLSQLAPPGAAWPTGAPAASSDATKTPRKEDPYADDFEALGERSEKPTPGEGAARPAAGYGESTGNPLFDSIRRQAMLLEEIHRLQEQWIRHFLAPLLPPSLRQAQAPAPREAPSSDDEVTELLRRAQLLLLQHPIAAQAAFAALVAEGRRFAETPEGAAWMASLSGSELIRRARRVWDAASLNMLEEDPSTIIPSAYLEALLRAARSPQMEELLRKLQPGTEGGPGAPPR